MPWTIVTKAEDVPPQRETFKEGETISIGRDTMGISLTPGEITLFPGEFSIVVNDKVGEGKKECYREKEAFQLFQTGPNPDEVRSFFGFYHQDGLSPEDLRNKESQAFRNLMLHGKEF